MRVGIVCDQYPPYTGGLERHVSDLVRGLSSRGVATSVFTTASDDRLPSDSLRQLKSLNGPFAGYHFWPGFLGTLLRGELSEVDLVHGFASSKFSSVCALIWSRVIGVPSVLTITYHPPEHSRHRTARLAYDILITAALLRFFDRIIVHSNAEMDSIQKTYGRRVPTSKFVKIEHASQIRSAKRAPNAADLSLPDSKFRILCVGRIDGIKRFADIVDAAVLLRQRGIDASIVHVGPSDDSEDGSALRNARESGLLKDLGAVEDSVLASVYLSADVTVVSSSFEAFGLVAIESLLMGTPVVGTRTGILPEVIVDGKNGYLYDSGDHHSLTARLEDVSRTMTRSFGTKVPLISVEKFGTQMREIDDTIRVYSEMLGSRD